MKPRRKLTKVFSLMLFGVSLLSIVLIGLLWAHFEKKRAEQETQRLSREYIATGENSLKAEINRICNYIEAQRQTSEIKFFTEIKNFVYTGYNMVAAIEESLPPDLSPQELEEVKRSVLAALKTVRLHEGRGRYFVSNLSGQELFDSEPASTAVEQGSSFDSFAYSSPSAFMEIVLSLNRLKEGFFRYNLIQIPNEQDKGGHSISQTSFLKIFEPWGWIIGSGEHFDQWIKRTQTDVLNWAYQVPLDNLAILDYSGQVLAHTNPKYRGLNMLADIVDPSVRKMAASAIRRAKEQGHSFMIYHLTDQDNSEIGDRISYIQAIPAWRWVVAGWIYSTNLEKALAEQQAIMNQNLRSQIYRIAAISLAMLLFTLLLSRALSSVATRSFASFFKFFRQAATLSTEMNEREQAFEEFHALAVAANNMIRQRKEAEKLVRENELKLKTIFDVFPQVITISDTNGVLLQANDEFSRYSVCELRQAIGHHLEDSFVIDGSLRRDLWRQLRESGSLAGREIVCQAPDGSELNLLAFGRLISLSSDTFILLIFTDISDLKAAEKEKLILQEKLARANKMETMGLMAAEVAHDLNNILSGIIGYPQLLLLEPNLTAQQKEIVGDMFQTGQRAAAVVSDLLTIARGVASNKVVLSVNKVVKGYATSLEARQLKEFYPKVKLELRLEPQAGEIQASEHHLTKILMNLVSNAIEAVPPDQDDGLVTIATGHINVGETPPPLAAGSEPMAPGDYVFIKVQDNGPGIKPEDLDKIFEPFYSNKPKGRSGTGLGLAIVWNTIGDHQGHVNVQSSPEGTTFTIYFKRVQQSGPVAQERRKLDDYRGQGQRILVVDDVDIQRKLACKMLSTLGYEALSVPSGEKAVEFLRSEEVDLVILDMIMHPGLNGRETYVEIKKIKPQQKAIIASGMVEAEEVAKAQALGAGDFVKKPYTLEDIAVAVHKALNSG